MHEAMDCIFQLAAQVMTEPQPELRADRLLERIAVREDAEELRAALTLSGARSIIAALAFEDDDEADLPAFALGLDGVLKLCSPQGAEMVRAVLQQAEQGERVSPPALLGALAAMAKVGLGG